MRPFSAVLILALATNVFAEKKTEVISDSYTYSNREAISQEVCTKNGSVYGLKFGASEGDVRSHFGDPIGIAYTQKNERIFIYGSQFVITLKSDRFSKASIGSRVFDYYTQIELETNPLFDTSQWLINGTVGESDDFDKVTENLALRKQTPSYKITNIDGDSLLTLHFTSLHSYYEPVR